MFEPFTLTGEATTKPKKKEKPKPSPKPEKEKKHFKAIGTFKSCLSIKPNYCADFSLYLPTQEELQDRRRPISNISKGEMSRAARGRLMAAINWMVLFSPRKFVRRKAPKKNFYFKVNFITLTLSDAQMHDDEWIKAHMLEPFLKWMKRKHNAINYVWRAETQENGNIHFHITTNKYIHHTSIRNKWNQLQHDNGYIRRFFDIYGDHEAPSIDVKAVKNTKELAQYMGKYFAKDRPEKQPNNLTNIDRFPRPEFFEICMASIACGGMDNLRRAVTGKQWACSTSLSKVSVCISESDPDYWEARKDWLSMYGKEKKETDHADIYFTNWNMDSQAPPLIAKKIMSLCEKFNTGDDGILKYDVSMLD
jgi:hypothetical protein